MRLLLGMDREVTHWVHSRIPYAPHMETDKCRAIGVVSGDNLVAGVVFNEYQHEYGTIAVSVAAETPRWAAKGVIRGILAYPFEQLNVNKVWSAMLHTNERAIRFNKGIGFRQEAVLRDHFGVGKHAVVTRMMRRDYQQKYGNVTHG